jgi:FMN phosphatase YigB (HAD superfamily)
VPKVTPDTAFVSNACAAALRTFFSAPQRERYAAMTRAALVSVAIVVFTSSVQAQDKWPSDVARFIERRNGCDHFRGEEPYDKERREFLNQKMTELCPGTDKALADLKDKYRRNKRIMAVLNEYEPQIESPVSTK